jgi:hypothetical protein
LNFGTAVVNRFTTADGMLLINTPLLGYNFDTNAQLNCVANWRFLCVIRTKSDSLRSQIAAAC